MGLLHFQFSDHVIQQPFFRFENMTASTMTFLVPGFLFFFVIQLAGAMEEISILQNSTLKNHTVSS